MCFLHDSREELTEYHSKAVEQASEHQNKEERLLDKLHNAQKLQKDAKEKCEGRCWFPFSAQHMQKNTSRLNKHTHKTLTNEMIPL